MKKLEEAVEGLKWVTSMNNDRHAFLALRHTPRTSWTFKHITFGYRILGILLDLHRVFANSMK